MQGSDQIKDPYRKTAELLRDGKKGVDYAQAKLEREGEGNAEWVEFVRGKDLARYLRKQPEVMEGLVQPIRAGRSVEDLIRDLVHFFIHKSLMLKCDRKYKRPKPGKPRLVKFPRTLVPAADQSWDEKAFYVWDFDRPTTIWYYLGAFALPFVVILACLFPLAPWWMRVTLAYVSMAILTVMLLTIFIRYTVFSVVWTLTGYSIWIFPNMMSDTVGVLDAFRPVITIDPPEAGKSQWKQRLGAGIVLVGFFYILATNTDVDVLKEELLAGHDSLFEYLDLHGKGKKFLVSGINDTGLNDTIANLTANLTTESI